MTAVGTEVRTATASEYAALMAEVRRTNLLERSAIRYLPRVVVLTVMVAVGIVALILLQQSWWQLATAAYLAILLAQLGFLGHDAGHQQIFRRRSWNDTTGMLLSNLGIGISYRWWVDKHNRHHCHPNDVAHDPDVQRNALVWTVEQASEARGPLLRFIARHQGVLFFPLLTLEAMNLHVGSVRGLFSRSGDRRRVECALMLSHVAIGSAALLLIMSPLHALAFVGVEQGLLGVYLGSSFAPNHKGMPMFDGDSPTDFLRRQVSTSRNVRGGRILGAALGNLNYQIEHHLFPSMPSHQLRHCQPIVKAFCERHAVDYCETNMFASYGVVLRYLRRVGAPRAT